MSGRKEREQRRSQKRRSGATRRQNRRKAELNPSTLHSPQSRGAVTFNFTQLRQESKARREFKDWKETLCRIINRESQMVTCADGYEFLIPPRLTRLVHEVMVRERMKVDRKVDEKKREDAEADVKEEMDKAVEKANRAALLEVASKRLNHILRSDQLSKARAIEILKAALPQPLPDDGDNS